MKAVAVGFLALAKECRGKRVLPSEAVPIVDVLAQNNHQRTRNGLVSIKLEQRIGWGATGAALGGKHLDDDGSTASFYFGSRGCIGTGQQESSKGQGDARESLKSPSILYFKSGSEEVTLSGAEFCFGYHRRRHRGVRK
jgi:hypothetical protein